MSSSSKHTHGQHPHPHQGQDNTSLRATTNNSHIPSNNVLLPSAHNEHDTELNPHDSNVLHHHQQQHHLRSRIFTESEEDQNDDTDIDNDHTASSSAANAFDYHAFRQKHHIGQSVENSSH